ncbi:MAG: hypothetical protein CK428_26105 [Mycobacterium sp.]|nr:MAG: hypothetical protein CK428_26105 [Mycobacterium sp.]
MGKNVADVVVGMLSDVGSATRPPARATDRGTAPASKAETPAPVTPQSPEPSDAPPAQVQAADPAKAASISPASSSPLSRSDRQGEPGAPRTLRLRPETAGELRAAWLSAKREDVLLTAQDFASDLVEEALRLRRRRQRVASSA